eukprot:GHVS01105243.1.p1 GENE.GHVS01105243.1~~GHVS01105243.1.p1  ORF type:complete len:853 (-),score=131.96 GHVS01105243.1:81-2366(-)
MLFVQQLNQHLRRIQAAASVGDISRIFRAFQHMQWRSSDTIRKLSQQFLLRLSTEAQPHHIRNVLTVFPRLHMPVVEAYQVELYRRCGDHLVLTVRSLQPADFALCLNSFVRANQNHAQLFDVCAIHLAPLLPSLTSVQLALVANAYARANKRPLALLRAISMQTRTRSDLNSQDLSNLVNAFARLDYFEPQLFEHLAPIIAARVREFQPQGLANVANAYARAGVKSELLFERLSMVSMFWMQKFKAQEIANLANAYAKLEIRDKALFCRIADEIIYRGTIGKKFFHFDIRSLEQLANAFAKLGLRDSRVFFVLSVMLKDTVARDGVEQVDGQTVATLMHSFGKARMKMNLFVPFITYQTMRVKDQLSTVGLVSVLTGCYKLDVKHRGIFTAALHNSKERLEQFSPAGLVMLLRAMGKLNIYKRTLLRRSLKICGLHLARMDVLSLCTLAQALADLRYRDPEFLLRLARVVQIKTFDISLHHLSITLSAYARLRVTDERLFALLLRCLFEQQHRLTLQEALSAAHALALMEDYQWDPALMEALLAVTLRARSALPMAAVRMLQGLELFLRAMQPKVYEQLSFPLREFLTKTRKVNVCSHDTNTSSHMLRYVSKCLHQVGLAHRSQVRLGPLSLDIVLGGRTVVEVDGESSFYRDTDMRTAKSLLKHGLLAAMGWRVLHLPYQEWDQCVTLENKLVYCASFWKQLVPADFLPVPGQKKRVGDILELLHQNHHQTNETKEEDEPFTQYQEGVVADEEPAFYSV